MMRLVYLMTVVVGSLLLGCGGAAQNSTGGDEVVTVGEDQGAAESSQSTANTDDIEFFSKVDPSVDITTFKNYAWVAIEGAIRDPEGKWTVPDLNIAKELSFLVDRELRGLGMTEVAENPDVLVAYSVVVDMEAVDLLKDKDNNMDITNVPKSALFVAFIDPDSEEAVWVGAAAGNVQAGATNESMKARLDYAVTKIIKSTGI